VLVLRVVLGRGRRRGGMLVLGVVLGRGRRRGDGGGGDDGRGGSGSVLVLGVVLGRGRRRGGMLVLGVVLGRGGRGRGGQGAGPGACSRFVRVERERGMAERGRERYENERGHHRQQLCEQKASSRCWRTKLLQLRHGAVPSVPIAPLSMRRIANAPEIAIASKARRKTRRERNIFGEKGRIEKTEGDREALANMFFK
jgi:hypothetical protein